MLPSILQRPLKSRVGSLELLCQLTVPQKNPSRALDLCALPGSWLLFRFPGDEFCIQSQGRRRGSAQRWEQKNWGILDLLEVQALAQGSRWDQESLSRLISRSGGFRAQRELTVVSSQEAGLDQCLRQDLLRVILLTALSGINLSY